MAEIMAIEIAEYIERGLQSIGRAPAGRVMEAPFRFLEQVGRCHRAGVLGLALIGKTGDLRSALDTWIPVSNISPAGKFAAIASLLGISVGLARLIDLNHRNGVPAHEIATGLRIGNLGLSFRAKTVSEAKAAAAPSVASWRTAGAHAVEAVETSW